jgi:hypothetical protein
VFGTVSFKHYLCLLLVIYLYSLVSFICVLSHYLSDISLFSCYLIIHVLCTIMCNINICALSHICVLSHFVCANSYLCAILLFVCYFIICVNHTFLFKRI